MVRKRKIRIHCAGNNSTWEFEKWEGERKRKEKKLNFEILFHLMESANKY